jgi:proliferating cell nuclear antigen PCNA
MDSSHVALVSMFMRAAGFDAYKADRNISLGLTLGSMAKVLKCAGNDDIITLKAEDTGDQVSFMFETPSTLPTQTHTLLLSPPPRGTYPSRLHILACGVMIF